MGSGFGAVRGAGKVLVGGAEGHVLSWSDTEVTFSVPPGGRTGVVRLQQKGLWSNLSKFKVLITGGDTTLTPDVMSLVAGETRTIQALDANGNPVTGLTWLSSDPTVLELSNADPPVLTALAAGNVTITAGSASADVTVYPDILPVGTVIWSNSGNGSGVNTIVPAVPSETGIADVFAFQGDGTVQAITSDGATAWTTDLGWSYFVPDFQGGGWAWISRRTRL
jgi:hypothetical protein